MTEIKERALNKKVPSCMIKYSGHTLAVFFVCPEI